MLRPRPGHLRPRLLVSILLVAVSGCAYYNTFYLAKRYYKEAQKEQERAITGNLSPTAGTKFDQVIRQCTKVITEYPKSKWVDDAMFLMGSSLYGKGDYPTAISRMQELQDKFPKSPFVPEARLVQGLAHFKRKDYVVADSIFHAVDAAYPKFSRRWELYFYEAETKAAQRDVPAALWWYERAVDAAGERREKSDALRRAGDALFTTGRMDSAQVLYDRTLKEEERAKERLDVAIRRGEALREMKKYREALEFLEEWRSRALDLGREGEVLVRVHELQGLLGRAKDAIEGYRRLVERFPNTNVAAEAQFQIGYLYETALGDLDQAAREYDKLRAMGASGGEFTAQAARRSQSLTTLKRYQQDLAADTTGARARSAFRLAEVNYFELGKPDSAVAQYRSVETLFPNSVYAPKSAYARLWISAYDRNDTLGTMLLTDTIAARYRGTRYAESALYLWKRWSGRRDARTALFDSLLANPDTSAASRFAEDTELSGQEDPALAAPSAPDSGYVIPPALYQQLQERAAQAKGTKRGTGRSGMPSYAIPADSSAAPGPLPAPADSTRAPSAPPDSSRAPSAPADTTRSSTPAPADTTRRSTPAPADSTK
jgi:TolA-binding protein